MPRDAKVPMRPDGGVSVCSVTAGPEPSEPSEPFEPSPLAPLPPSPSSLPCSSVR